MEARARLAGDAKSAREARRFVSTTLAEWSMDDVADAVALLVSELVTNSVLHARTSMELSLESSGEQLRVAVADDNPQIPQQRRYSRESATGRGLKLVEALSSSWGIETRVDGKSVWFTISTGDDREDGSPSGGFDVDEIQSL